MGARPPTSVACAPYSSLLQGRAGPSGTVVRTWSQPSGPYEIRHRSQQPWLCPLWIWGVPGKGARGTPDKALTQSLGCITGQAEDLGASWGHPSGLEDLSLGIAQGWVQGELSFPGSGFVQGASAWCRDGGRGQWVEAPGVGEQATAPRDGDSLGVRRGGTAPACGALTAPLYPGRSRRSCSWKAWRTRTRTCTRTWRRTRPT